MNYRIIYSVRRTVSLCVKDGEVIVRAPEKTDRDYIDSLVTKHKKWLEEKLEQQQKKREREPVLTASDIAKLKRTAKEYFTTKTKEYADTMGLKYGRITITSAKTRFGSCSSKRNICFSYRLMLYPEEAREYVIVHELCHLVYMNHSAAFYRMLERYMPDHKLRKAMLK